VHSCQLKRFIIEVLVILMSRKSNFTFRKVLLISFILISAVPVILLAYWVQDSALQNEFKAVEEKHLNIAKNLTSTLERYIFDIEAIFEVIASHNQQDVHSVEIFQLLKQMNFQHIWHIDKDKQSLIYDHNNILKELVVPENIAMYFEQFQSSPDYKKNRINFSGVLEGVENDNVFLVSKKLPEGGYLVGSVSTTYILQIQSKIVFGERGHAAIVDQFGKVIAHPVKTWHESRKDISFLPPVQNMMLGLTGVTQFYTPAMQADMIAGHTAVDKAGWGVMIPQPVSELEDNAASVQYIALILAMIGVAIAGLISWWLASYITRTLAGVIQFTENVASGELDTRIPIEKGLMPLELQKMITSFNRMIDKLKHKTEVSVLLTDRLREAQHIAKLGSWKINIVDNTMWWSEEVYNILELNQSDIASPTLDDFVIAMEQDQREDFIDSLKKAILTHKPFSLDNKMYSKSGEAIYVHQDIVVQSNSKNKFAYISGTFQDVSERKKHEDALYARAHYDDLTGLPNRRLCLETLETDLQQAKERNQVLPFLLIGLDHFKEINGSLGHNIGDKLLSLAGDRLRNATDESDFIARLGSDEFSIVLRNIDSYEKIFGLAKKIIEEFQKPFTVDHYETVVGVSIGISIYPDDDALNPLLLLQKADTALHAAKAAGRGGYEVFTSAMDERVIARMNYRSDLPAAIENSEFHLVFQPIVDSKTGKVICAESLIRWIHPTKGFIPPDKFIAIAEESGYIGEIGLWVIDEACKELKKWHDSGYRDLYISVNLSLRQIQLGLKKNTILDILHKHHIDPKFLTLEITESLLMEDLDKNLHWLNDVKSTGIRFSIDDFGTGYSSLSYLLNLPVTTLKIDRSFVMNILEGSKDAVLIEMIITLSKRLGYKIVAEGVETEGQLIKLREYECDLIQGYYFSKPLVSEEFMKYLCGVNKVDNITNINQLK